MKLFLASVGVLSVIAFFVFSQKKETPQNVIVKKETCFSVENYQKIHDLVAQKKEKKSFWTFGGYNIYPQKENLSFKIEGFTLGRITKEKGIFSLAKDSQDNERITKEVENIFCTLINTENTLVEEKTNSKQK